jgi:hypothetical protein
MHLIALHRHRLAALAVVVVLALGLLALFASFNPWGAGATNQSKATNPANTPAADHRSTVAGELVSANPWAVNGLSPETLPEGWTCDFVVHAVHCLPPGAFEGIVTGTAETANALVFDADSARFLGTELNIRGDVFKGQPCPTDPPSREYTHFSAIGLPFDYYACHRFDSPL